VAQPGPDGSPPGHIAAMEAKSATLQQNQTAPAGVPATLPPEFLATYETWKAGQATPKPAETTEKPAETPAVPDTTKPLTVPEKPPETVEEAGKVVESAGLKMDDFSEEFAKDGKLSDTSYEKLSKAGIPKEMVDGFIAGQQAIAERQRADVLSAVGGETAFAQIAAWATTNVPKAEIEAINTALADRNPAIQKLALQGLQARFTAANGRDPSLVNRGPNAGNSGTDVFASRAQHVEAMKDPRYSKDPAYRTAVMEKAMRSTF
jgi:hypothetical protein